MHIYIDREISDEKAAVRADRPASQYIYIYIYTHTSLSLYLSLSLSLSLSIYIYIYICICTHMYIHIRRVAPERGGRAGDSGIEIP